jgi:hypothetical protein
MLRVTSRQRLVSWDAFDATATATTPTATPQLPTSTMTMTKVGDDAITEAPIITTAATDHHQHHSIVSMIASSDAVSIAKRTNVNANANITATAPPAMLVPVMVHEQQQKPNAFDDDEDTDDTDTDDTDTDTSSSSDVQSQSESDDGYLTCACVSPIPIRNTVLPVAGTGEEDEDADADVEALASNLCSTVMMAVPVQGQGQKRDRDHIICDFSKTLSPTNNMKRNVSFSTRVTNKTMMMKSSNHDHDDGYGYGPTDVFGCHNDGYDLMFPDLPDNNDDADAGIISTDSLLLEADADAIPLLSLLSPASIRKSRGSCASFMTACASSDSMMDLDMMDIMNMASMTSPTKTAREPVVGLCTIADDVKLLVCSYLSSATEVRALGATCKSLQTLVRSPHVWIPLLQDKFPLMSQLGRVLGNSTSTTRNYTYHDDSGTPMTPHTSLGDGSSTTTNNDNAPHVHDNDNAPQTDTICNLSALYALAQPYPTHIDEAFFKPIPHLQHPYSNNLTSSSSSKPAAFCTFMYRLKNSSNSGSSSGASSNIRSVPVVQFTGRVGTGDRCVQSNVAFPSTSTLTQTHQERERARARCCVGRNNTNNNTNTNKHKTLAKWCPQSLLDLLRRGGSSTLISMDEGALTMNTTTVGDYHATQEEELTSVSTPAWPGPSAFASAAPFHCGTVSTGSPPPLSLPSSPIRSRVHQINTPKTNPAQIMSRTWHLCGSTTLKPFVAPYVVERPARQHQQTTTNKKKHATLKDNSHHGDAGLEQTNTNTNTNTSNVLDINLSPRLFAYFEVTILERDESQEPMSNSKEEAQADGSTALPQQHQGDGDGDGNGITRANTTGTYSRRRSSSSTTTTADCIAIGLATSKFDARHKMPGWCAHSYGYHGDDGGIFHGAGDMLREFGPRFGNHHHNHDNNDIDESSYTGPTVVGCGMDYANQGIFFTLNGTFLGYAWRGICFDTPLYPTVGVDSNQPLEINFGHRPFRFNVTTSFAHHHAALINTSFLGFPAAPHDVREEVGVAPPI